MPRKEGRNKIKRSKQMLSELRTSKLYIGMKWQDHKYFEVSNERKRAMEPNKKMPLFILTGASCVGKSTMSEILFKEETKYIVMESDLLWNDIYNKPEDDYRDYRELWLKVCCNISQIGLPVVLCGCAVPKQFEICHGRDYFTNLYYLAVVCDDNVLEHRMRDGRGVTDDNWIKSSIDFNRWLKNNYDKTTPNIKCLDNSKLTPDEAAEIANAWVLECMQNERSQGLAGSTVPVRRDC